MRNLLIMAAIFLLFGQEISFMDINLYHRMVVEKIHAWSAMQLNIEPINKMVELPEKYWLNDH